MMQILYKYLFICLLRHIHARPIRVYRPMLVRVDKTFTPVA